jgi:hypothetical protein
MWTPPIVWTAEEQKIATRPRQTRKCFVFLRAHRPELLAADLPHTLANSSSPEPGGHAPVEAGRLALATLLPASWHGGDRDAVELTVLEQRWQRVLACLAAEPPPCSQGPLCNFRMRLITHNLDQTLRERSVAWAEPTGGCGARPRRAVLASPPLCGAGRVEDTLHRLGHARRKAVGLAAQALGTSAAAVGEDAGRTLVGHSSRKAALDRDGGEPRARSRALGLSLEEGQQWPCGLEQQPTLGAQPPPLQEVMETITQILPQDTEPAPEGGPGGRRLKQHVAPARRIAMEAPDMRHGRTSRATTFHGFKEHCAVDVDSTVTREGVGRPATEPEHAALEWLAEAWEQAPGLLHLDRDLGSRASPRMAQWAEQGVYIIARPWPQGGPLGPQNAFTLAFGGMPGTCPGGQSVPMVPGKPAQFPATACDAGDLRAQCTTATPGQGKSVRIREDEPCQQKLRAKMKTQRGRAALRKRTAVEHTRAPPLVHQGRRARYKGLRQNPFDGRRHAAVSNLQIAARSEEEHRLAS